MKKEYRCIKCREWGDPQTRIIDSGYTPAHVLGRPRGAKGKDWAETETYCFHCGAIDAGFELAESPCWVCGKEGSDLELSVYSLVPGWDNDIPGVPYHFNVHSGECEVKARDTARKYLREAIDDGCFE